MKLFKLVLASILATTALLAGTFNVDKSHSHVGFNVKHMMISNVVGNFKEFEGTINYDEKTKTLHALNGTVKVSSINTENAKRDKHLKEDDFFAISKYPQIKFESVKVQGEELLGKLTIRGVTKEVKFDLENNGVIKDSWGNTRVSLSLEAKINRKDYGLTYNKILEAGGVAISDKVKLIINLEGILKK